MKSVRYMLQRIKQRLLSQMLLELEEEIKLQGSREIQRLQEKGQANGKSNPQAPAVSALERAPYEDGLLF